MPGLRRDSFYHVPLGKVAPNMRVQGGSWQTTNRVRTALVQLVL